MTRRNDKPAPERPPRQKEKGNSGGFHMALAASKRGGSDRSRAGSGTMLAAFRSVARTRQQRLVIPFRPVLTRAAGMCAEQLADLKAAQQGGITWAQYFRKWGPSL